MSAIFQERTFGGASGISELGHKETFIATRQLGPSIIAAPIQSISVRNEAVRRRSRLVTVREKRCRTHHGALGELARTERVACCGVNHGRSCHLRVVRQPALGPLGAVCPSAGIEARTRFVWFSSALSPSVCAIARAA